jgi:hypothetical protein
MAQSVRDLFASALASQARRGDSLGVWTFNEDVYTGLLPLQQFSPVTLNAVSGRVVGFLKTQKLENNVRFDKLVAAIDRVARASAFITVVMVCLGDDEIHGTPFDQRINDFFRTWHQKQQDAGTPFVIALRAQKGKFVDCSMTPSPWPAELPSLPKELFVPVVTPRPPTTEPRKAPPPVPPLIISGKKGETIRSGKNLEATVATNPMTIAATNSGALPQPDPTAAGARENSGKTPSALPGLAPLKADASSTAADLSNGTASQGTQESHWANPSALQTPGSISAVEQHATVPSDSQVATLREPASTASGEVATSISPAHGIYPFVLGGVAFSSLSLAVAAFWISRRRSRRVREVSLITESIDRREK